MKLINHSRKMLGVVIAACLSGIAAPAFAITDEEGKASLQFSFVPPKGTSAIPFLLRDAAGVSGR